MSLEKFSYSKMASGKYCLENVFWLISHLINTTLYV